MGRLAGVPNKITSEVKRQVTTTYRRFNSFFKRKLVRR